MKTTRKDDLDVLDSSRKKAKTELGKEHREALLAAVQVQSEDPFLEEMRLQFQDAYKIGIQYRDEHNIRGMAEVEIVLKKIEKAITDYTASPAFLSKVAKEVEKISKQEADKVVSTSIKNKKGLNAK